MDFNQHSALKGNHAFLSPSSPYWLNYDVERLRAYRISSQAAIRGTKLHEYACMSIQLGQKLPRSTKTLNMYVNDAIGFRMTPEQILFYSFNIFGTCDAICFRDNMLRIHDLKTGVTPAHMEQLFIYDALFCLEYKVNPENIKIENRIYQNDAIVVETPDATVIRPIMDIIVNDDKLIEEWKREEG